MNNYRLFAEKYLEVFEPLFEAAEKVSEFDVILALLGIRGVQASGWDPFENTESVVEDLQKHQARLRHSVKANVNLWAYAHVIESSENYELVANLLEIAQGGNFKIANHRSKQPTYKNLRVADKIARLTSMAKGTAFESISDPFKDVFDSKFRNALYHADYSIKDGGVTFFGDDHYPTFYDRQHVIDLINKSLALHNVLHGLRKQFVGQYLEPKQVMCSPGFGRGKPFPVTLLVRRGHGVIGFKGLSNETDLGASIEVAMYRCLPYEKPLIQAGQTFMPRNRIQALNNVLDKMPVPVATFLASRIGKLRYFTG